MQTVTSQDGTPIAFDKVGSGSAVILVNGALAYRAFGSTMAQLAEVLGTDFTVYNYDRRGRGASLDTRPFAREREMEDLQALVEDAGGTAMVFGISSGGVVSLDAAALTPGMTKVGVYETALIVDDSRQPVPADYTEHLTQLSAEGKRDEAVEYFLTQAMGIPAAYLGGMKQDQATWSGMTGVAHTIAYDAAFVGDVMQGKPLPLDRWVKVTVPVLMADGGASDAWLHHGADALAEVLPHASHQTLAGQTHMVDPNVLARSSSHSFSNNTRQAGGMDSIARFLPPPSHYLYRRCSEHINVHHRTSERCGGRPRILPQNGLWHAHYVMRNLTNEFDFTQLPSSTLREPKRRYSP